MISKIKTWLIGSVVLKKVAGKFAKHGTGAIIGLLTSVKVAPYLAQLGITLDPGQLEAGLTILLIALFGAIYNFMEHRFFK
jgi:hypothetical protein